MSEVLRVYVCQHDKYHIGDEEVFFRRSTKTRSMLERPLPVFYLSGIANEVAQRWQRWKRSFNYYVEGEGISGASKLRSKMPHLAGMPVQDIFATFTEPVVPKGRAALDDYERR